MTIQDSKFQGLFILWETLYKFKPDVKHFTVWKWEINSHTLRETGTRKFITSRPVSHRLAWSWDVCFENILLTSNPRFSRLNDLEDTYTHSTSVASPTVPKHLSLLYFCGWI